MQCISTYGDDQQILLENNKIRKGKKLTLSNLITRSDQTQENVLIDLSKDYYFILKKINAVYGESHSKTVDFDYDKKFLYHFIEAFDPKPTDMIYNLYIFLQSINFEKIIPTMLFGSKYNEIKAYIEENRLPTESISLIQNKINEIHTYLKENNISYETRFDIFEDPDDSSINLIKIKLLLNKELDFIYENLEEPLYNLFFKNLTKELHGKLLLTLDSID